MTGTLESLKAGRRAAEALLVGARKHGDARAYWERIVAHYDRRIKEESKRRGKK